MFEFLRAIGLEPQEWTQLTAFTGEASPYIGTILDAGFRQVQAVLALLTPDDLARLRDDLVKEDDPAEEKALTGQPRPNVLFEGGMAFASHPKETVLVQVGKIRHISDLSGRHVVIMDNSVAKRQDLAMKLKTAGCSVNLDGTDWHTAGDFSSPAEGGAVLQERSNHPGWGASSPAAGKSRLREFKRVTISPVSRGTSEGQYTLTTTDDLGVVIQLPGGISVRIPKPDYIESWDDSQRTPKLVLTRKYFQGYFPGHEHAEEYFLPR